MEFYIKHEIKGYLRVHMAQASMTSEEARILQYHLQELPQVIQDLFRDIGLIVTELLQCTDDIRPVAHVRDRRIRHSCSSEK